MKRAVKQRRCIGCEMRVVRIRCVSKRLLCAAAIKIPLSTPNSHDGTGGSSNSSPISSPTFFVSPKPPRTTANSITRRRGGTGTPCSSCKRRHGVPAARDITTARADRDHKHTRLGGGLGTADMTTKEGCARSLSPNCSLPKAETEEVKRANGVGFAGLGESQLPVPSGGISVVNEPWEVRLGVGVARGLRTRCNRYRPNCEVSRCNGWIQSYPRYQACRTRFVYKFRAKPLIEEVLPVGLPSPTDLNALHNESQQRIPRST